jgi:predicted membrane protein
MFLGLILDILFLIVWLLLALDFSSSGYGIVYSIVVSFIISFSSFFFLGIFLAILFNRLKINIIKNNEHIKHEHQVNDKLLIFVFDDKDISSKSEEIACIFKNTKFPKWIKIKDLKLFFKDVIHTNENGIYNINELPKQSPIIILNPGAIYEPEDVQQN